MQADDNGDGNISYDEFVPVCFNLLSEMIAKQVRAAFLMQMIAVYTPFSRSRTHFISLRLSILNYQSRKHK